MVLVALASVAAASDTRSERHGAPLPPVGCVDLASVPAHGLLGGPVVKSVTSQIVPASGPNMPYCQVDLPVNAGYVGSGTDTGHAGGDCTPGVNEDGTYNLQFIQDFVRSAIKAQVLFSKAIAGTYYGMKPAYDYWNGCSTGGRQGYLLAQELGSELDGILANAPAIYWTRFQTAQMWGPIATTKLSQATASAVAACDAADGVADGVIDDPRSCRFSAAANVCGTPTAPAADCLTAAEAEAIDRIWDGPRNAKGNRVWFGLDRGTQLGGPFSLNGPTPFFLGVIQLQWNEHDGAFDWRTATADEYAQIAQDGSRNIADVTDSFSNLDSFRRHGGKLLTFVGANDQLIHPRGVVHYYRLMASRYGKRAEPDFERLQQFYRLFRGPGVAHCAGGAGPQPQNLFGALVNWVENGVPPERVLAQTTVGGVTRTRPLCPYSQTAIYRGTGSTDDASSFRCGGNLEKRRVVCADVLTAYKHEVNGPLDFKGTGVNRFECFHDGHGHGHHAEP